MGLSYKDAGVDIDAGDQLVERIKPVVKSTHRKEVLGAIGGFAGMCALPSGYENPILVSGTDGVGTKLKSALETGRHSTIGIDLVAMCVNDVIVTGAEPLFFLDYYASAALDIDVASAVIAGIAEGCKRSGCSLVGGETAEMPGLYKSGDYDLAGFCVGVVERDKIHSGQELAEGDLIIGIQSSGLHSNGHSLARKALLEKLDFSYTDKPEILAGQSIADVLLEPTTLYVRALLGLESDGAPWKSAAHITGGGLVDNPPRMLESPTLDIRLDTESWRVPSVFELIASAGVETAEMRRTFNMGLGMLVALTPDKADAAILSLQKNGYSAQVVGALQAGEGKVIFA